MFPILFAIKANAIIPCTVLATGTYVYIMAAKTTVVGRCVFLSSKWQGCFEVLNFRNQHVFDRRVNLNIMPGDVTLCSRQRDVTIIAGDTIDFVMASSASG